MTNLTEETTGNPCFDPFGGSIITRITRLCTVSLVCGLIQCSYLPIGITSVIYDFLCFLLSGKLKTGILNSFSLICVHLAKDGNVLISCRVCLSWSLVIGSFLLFHHLEG